MDIIDRKALHPKTFVRATLIAVTLFLCLAVIAGFQDAFNIDPVAGLKAPVGSMASSSTFAYWYWILLGWSSLVLWASALVLFVYEFIRMQVKRESLWLGGVVVALCVALLVDISLLGMGSSIW